MTESRADRDAFPPDQAVETVVADARAGRLDAEAVAAVVQQDTNAPNWAGRPG
jgi:HD-GYP domain-containing protein (c-di-GMP phosphodiesterase class II)